MDIPCICPVKPDGAVRHADGDRIELRERLDFRSSLAAQNTVFVLKAEDPDASSADILAALTESYLLSGVESWSVVDEKGKPVEPTRTAIRERLLTRLDVALIVAERADELYRDAVIAPLVRAASTSSRSTPTDESISAINGSPGPSRSRSSRSSTITTLTDDTEETLPQPAGASS